MSVDELFEIVDRRGRVIGTARRSECHGDPSLIHRVIHVFVFAPDGRLLLQKRSEEKDIQPGKWDTSVGGHLALGEGYEEAAAREMAEELGLGEIPPLEHMYDYLMTNAIESELVRTYRCVSEGPFRRQESEISELRLFTAAEIEDWLGSGRLTPNFEEEWGRYGAWLKEGGP